MGKKSETEFQKADISKAVNEHVAEITQTTSVENGVVHVSRRHPSGIKPKGLKGKRRKNREKRQEVEVEINSTQNQQKEMTAIDQITEAPVEVPKKDVEISSPMIDEDSDNIQNMLESLRDEEVCGGEGSEDEGLTSTEIDPGKAARDTTARDGEVGGGEGS